MNFFVDRIRAVNAPLIWIIPELQKCEVLKRNDSFHSGWGYFFNGLWFAYLIILMCSFIFHHLRFLLLLIFHQEEKMENVIIFVSKKKKKSITIILVSGVLSLHNSYTLSMGFALELICYRSTGLQSMLHMMIGAQEMWMSLYCKK